MRLLTRILFTAQCVYAYSAAIRCRIKTFLPPSACLSVTQRYCVETAQHTIILFHNRVTTQFWVFSYQILSKYSDNDLPNGGGVSIAGRV